MLTATALFWKEDYMSLLDTQTLAPGEGVAFGSDEYTLGVAGQLLHWRREADTPPGTVLAAEAALYGVMGAMEVREVQDLDHALQFAVDDAVAGFEGVVVGAGDSPAECFEVADNALAEARQLVERATEGSIDAQMMLDMLHMAHRG